MPNYDYRCTSCGNIEEIFQSMSEVSLSKCPACGKETFERIVTGGAGVLYKGEGWYVTDYSKKSSGGKEATTPPVAPAVKTKASTPKPD